MSKTTIFGLMSILWITTFAANSLADDLIVYPSRNQSAQQQDKDQWECRSWATKQTGFDPASRPTSSTPPPTRQPPRGGVVRGAAGGAALGAIGGAIAGNAGKGAAIGAVGGGAIGAVRRNDQRRQDQQAQQQWAQQANAEYEQKRSTWLRAVKACLTGRGYTVQ